MLRNSGSLLSFECTTPSLNLGYLYLTFHWQRSYALFLPYLQYSRCFSTYTVKKSITPTSITTPYHSNVVLDTTKSISKSRLCGIQNTSYPQLVWGSLSHCTFCSQISIHFSRPQLQEAELHQSFKSPDKHLIIMPHLASEIDSDPTHKSKQGKSDRTSPCIVTYPWHDHCRDKLDMRG